MLKIEELKVGDILVCTKDMGWDFTAGNEYKVIAKVNGHVALLSDEGHSFIWFSVSTSGFKLKEDLRDLSQVGYGEEIIKKIERPCECGCGWITVWKREEDLFTLELKGHVKLPYYAHGNKNAKYLFTFRKNAKPVNEEKYKTMFTQEEIDNLPNQEFIKTLVKKKVV